MKKIELTQNQVTLVDDVDYEYLSQWKWYAHQHRKNFRAERGVWSNGKRKTIRMHRIVAERMDIDSEMIDHKDRNPLNNQRSNLRSATESQNGHNCGVRSDNTTGVKGVCFDKSCGRYRARIRLFGKLHHFGRFDTITEAAVVVRRKRKELVGEFAHG